MITPDDIITAALYDDTLRGFRLTNSSRWVWINREPETYLDFYDILCDCGQQRSISLAETDMFARPNPYFRVHLRLHKMHAHNAKYNTRYDVWLGRCDRCNSIYWRPKNLQLPPRRTASVPISKHDAEDILVELDNMEERGLSPSAIKVIREIVEVTSVKFDTPPAD